MPGIEHHVGHHSRVVVGEVDGKSILTGVIPITINHVRRILEVKHDLLVAVIHQHFLYSNGILVIVTRLGF